MYALFTGARKLLVYVHNTVAAIFNFMTEEGWGQPALQLVSGIKTVVCDDAGYIEPERRVAGSTWRLREEKKHRAPIKNACSVG